jgi:two-component system nitrate/nitrite response regulator NarL
LFGVERFLLNSEHSVRKIRASNRAVKIVVLAASQKAGDITRALNVGISGFLLQDIPGDQLLKSLELIVLGETIIYPHFWMMATRETSCGQEVNDQMRVDEGASYLAAPLESAGETFSRLGSEESCGESSASHETRGLSSRELLILRTLMEGASNKVIARKLVITESTVKVHMKAILRKLRLQNRTQAAIWARNYLSEVHP